MERSHGRIWFVPALRRSTTLSRRGGDGERPCMIPAVKARSVPRECRFQSSRLLRSASVLIPLIVAACSVWPVPSSALVEIGPPPTLETRVSRSELIVLGRVGQRTNVVLSPSDSLKVPAVYSRHALVVFECWKGAVMAGDTISFANTGGQLPKGGWMSIGGAPLFREGETLVLFLARGSAGVWKRELTTHGSDGYVRVENHKGFGTHCPGKPIGWLKRRVTSIVKESSE
jgi:hypothetical protein